ncbi:ATP-binding protein [Curtobacterium ammoniigenes]|uniref:ATP-binding protein n=1 Tax=Curtobacterium ammoniigenes TaxID=395387 RepID=UPI0009F90F10|nr:SbcC/MukB-like Walker B domain-containing protein [Curtobacterium ammoniigenes]
MTMLFSNDEIQSDSSHVGQWRLARIELVNWGTFSGAVAVDVARLGHLFTGASGSGKSSLLDAIAAVLTPDRWLKLNAAAQDGASRQGDRTLMSYVRGAWTKEADERADRATTTYLRPRATWSGILLRYENLADEPVTLARVFHAPGTRTDSSALKDARLFLRGELELLSLKPHVENGIDARRMTTALPSALITTSGKHGRFHERVTRQFGFRGDTTLQLLHKTQSAKNLGTLDALFRGFMLDLPGTFARSDNAVEQFTELDRAHAHVVDLRRQADALGRVDASITAFDAASAIEADATRLRDAVEPYTATFKLNLAREALAPARATLARAAAALREAERTQQLASDALETARARVRDEGGARVELLQAQVDTAEADQNAVATRLAELTRDLDSIGAPAPSDAAQFAELVASAIAEGAHPIAALDYKIQDAASEARRTLEQLDAQLKALRDHRSNLDPRLLSARRYLAQSLSVPETTLPFAAELVSVIPDHAEWRGAIERVLTPFAPTLLVPDAHLAAVRRAADSRHLGVRLVMEAVPVSVEEPRRPRDPRSLVHRVAVADGWAAAYVRRRIATEYDYACVANPDEFDDIDRGVTVTGLVKRAARRYEKDDRSAVTDATRWVLGGDIDARLEALLVLRRQAEAAQLTTAEVVARASVERDALITRRTVFLRVAHLTWDQVDVASAERVTEARRGELHKLTSGSATLREAQQAQELAAEQCRVAESEVKRAQGDEAIAGKAVELVQASIDELEAARVEPVSAELAEDLGARFRAERRSLSLETVDAVARVVLSKLSHEKDAAGRRVRDAEAAFAGRAAEFRSRWPAVASELTIEIADRNGYRELLKGILERGLPDKVGEFRRLLRERSRDVVAHLLGDLRDAPGLIRERILPVNASLGRSPFEGADTFLEIDVKTRRSVEVEEFLAELRRIVEGNWADESERGAEQRFEVLQRVIGRLGSKDRVDLDWRTRVLDTRLHVSFLAREKNSARRVLRVYDSAEGLSGGQRQKLVIFCLAAALRYQLTEEEDDVPKYGSIVLDEAFDKADSRYTRNAMEVFRAFGFHMILATPQKLLQTLEPYVGAITSISNPDRRASRLANVVFDVADASPRPHAAEAETRA